MSVVNRDLLKLVSDLNSFIYLNKRNPYSSPYSTWPFAFRTDCRGITQIQLHDDVLLHSDYPRDMEKCLHEIKEELNQWLSALQSAIWSVNELLELKKVEKVNEI